ncbi:MAG: metallophosphoesterase [Firmicutes bacterium]|nr:metallophosphoesterase [Bacillota bacterium]
MKPVTSSKQPKRSRLLTCLFALAALIFLYAHLEPFWIATKTIPIMDADVPTGFDGTRIVFISDIHHGPYFSRPRLKRLVQRINALKPDLILLGGDYVHRSPRFIRSCFAELAHLQAPLGVYGVLGNHDHWAGAAASREAMVKAGIRPLDNRGYWIFRGGRRIRIGGVGDLRTDTQDLRPLLSGVKADDFTILVSHNPDFVEEIGPFADRIDLILNGHTHGGQVTFFGLWAPLVPSKYGQKYRTGVIDLAGMKAIVSNGIGTVTPPVRFFARPQIVVVVLKVG